MQLLEIAEMHLFLRMTHVRCLFRRPCRRRRDFIAVTVPSLVRTTPRPSLRNLPVRPDLSTWPSLSREALAACCIVRIYGARKIDIASSAIETRYSVGAADAIDANEPLVRLYDGSLLVAKDAFTGRDFATNTPRLKDEQVMTSNLYVDRLRSTDCGAI